MTADTREFTITRTFDAPRELVWKAWTDPRLFAEWFGPKGFTSDVKKMDVKAGGILHSSLTSPEGLQMWAKLVYREVTKPSRLVWEHSFSDKDGNLTRHPGQAHWPLKLLTTVNLEEAGDKARLTLIWVPLDATDTECNVFENEMSGMNEGWGGTFDQLDSFLEEKQAA